MSRHYSDEEKQHVLQRLIDNDGDVALTVAQTGVSQRTIFRWRRELPQNAALPLPPLPPLPPNDTDAGEHSAAPLKPAIPADDVEALTELKLEMLGEARRLVRSIEAAIEGAPLNQIVSALAQLTDRIIKLAAQLPSDDNEPILRIEYMEADGTITETTSPSGHDL